MQVCSFRSERWRPLEPHNVPKSTCSETIELLSYGSELLVIVCTDAVRYRRVRHSRLHHQLALPVCRNENAARKRKCHGRLVSRWTLFAPGQHDSKVYLS